MVRRFGHVGQHATRTDRIDADVLTRVFHRGVVGQADHAAFGGGGERLGAVGHHHARACSGQGDRARATDTACGAGHQCNLVVTSTRHRNSSSKCCDEAQECSTGAEDSIPALPRSRLADASGGGPILLAWARDDTGARHTGAQTVTGTLEGKVILVTSGNTGIGRATAQILAREGATVVIADLQDAEGARTLESSKDRGGKAEYQHVDVSDYAAVRALVSGIAARHGGLDCAFNNAGIEGPTA